MIKYRNYIYLMLLTIGLVSCSSGPNVMEESIQSNEVSSHELLMEVNFARTNPQEYADILERMLPFYEGRYYHVPGDTPVKTKEGNKPVIEAIKYLRSASPRQALEYSAGLSLAAMDHVRSQGPTGKIGHYGKDGSNPTTRIQKHGTPVQTWGENISYGPRTPRDIVAALIIDDGVKDRGHRHLLYHPDLRLVGFGYGPHKVYRNMCVMNFAVDFKEKQRVAVK